LADAGVPTAAGPSRAERWEARRRALIPALIALTSVLGAVGAWRAAVASGAAGGAERQAFADTVAAELQGAVLETQLASVEFTYARVAALEARAEPLEEAAAAAEGDEAARLEALAGAYRSTADGLRPFIDADALAADGSLGLEGARRTRLDLAGDFQDLDPGPEEAAIADYRAKAGRLVGLTALLVSAALFFTLAEVSRHRRTGVLFWHGGAAVLLVAVALLIVVEAL
jgi:hypothetical protein